MSLTLDLRPEVENALREYAAEEGVSISDLLARTFPPKTAHPHTNGTNGTTSREPQDRIQTLLSAWQQQYGLPTPPGGTGSLAELSAEWAAEDAALSPEDRQADRAFWEAFNARERQPLQF